MIWLDIAAVIFLIFTSVTTAIGIFESCYHPPIPFGLAVIALVAYDFYNESEIPLWGIYVVVVLINGAAKYVMDEWL